SFECPPFGFCAVGSRTSILPKGVLFFTHRLSFFEPLAQPGVFIYNKKVQMTTRIICTFLSYILIL
ncbi:MAG: hypothetical protein IKK09_12025, partial [Clostridia bacterium]|nr:hypothetical protein [Clostridia bacterium]